MGKFMFHKMLGIGALLALSGCMSYETTSETAQTASTKELCQSIAAVRAGNASGASAQLALETLRARGTFSASELNNIAKGVALPGMSEEAGLCAWGYYWYGTNRTTTAAGASTQYLFGDGKYNPRRYLYASNGVVTGTQE